jgi:hypothetical protein
MVRNDIAGDPATGRVILRGAGVLGRLEQWPRHLCIRAAMARSALLAGRALVFPVAVGQGIGTWPAVSRLASDPA